LLPSSRFLLSKTIGEGLKQVPDAAVSTASFIEERPLKSRIFAKPCESMQKYHVTLFQHTEVRWLSRGKVLLRVFEMRKKLQLFFKDNSKESFSSILEDTKWLLKLAYVADIYQHLNTLNTSIQDPKENILISIANFLHSRIKSRYQ
jgi:hypothetical protein